MWKERFTESQNRDANIKVSKTKKMVGDEIYDKYENLTLMGEISEGFKLFFKNFPFLVSVFLLCALLISVISMFSFSDLYWNIQQNIQSFYDEFGPDSTSWPENAIQAALPLSNTATFTSVGMTIVRFIPLTLGGVIVPYYLVEKIQNNKPSVSASIRRVFSKKRLKAIIFTILILTPLFAVGISFLYLPGIILIMLFGFTFFLIPGDFVGPVKIINSGYSYGRDFRLRTFALTTIGVAIFLFVGESLPRFFMPNYTSANYFIWLDPLNRNWGQLFLVEFLFVATQSFFQPIIFCFLAVQFVEISIARDQVLYDGQIDKSNNNIVSKKKVPKENLHAKIIRGKDENVNKYYCPECGSRLRPLKSQREITCIKCKSKIILSKKKSG